MKYILLALLVCVFAGKAFIYNNTMKPYKKYVVVKQYSWAKLSFDDWPTMYTPKVLDLLKEYNTTWAFYIVWKNIEGNEDIIKRMYNEWHDICVHTRNHTDITKMTMKEIVNDSERVYNKLNSIVPWKLSKCYRPPYWKVNHFNALRKMWYRIDWSLDVGVLDSMDWKYKNTDKIYTWLVTATWYTSIVFHDTSIYTVESLNKYLQLKWLLVQ